MEALLGATRANNSCGSVEELQDQLRNIFGTRVTPTAAQHITETFKLQSSVVFHVPVTDSENEVLENAASVDPQLGGAVSSIAPAQGHQTFRTINAMDALINQPHDDNVLQKSVAKHIVTLLSDVDGSTWIIRGVARTDQGWTFTYICKSSMQAWQRQTAKTPAKVPIGAYSSKDGLDPVNLSRPSFDCQGQLTVAFLKSSRIIEVKYDHAPLHKTVAELLEMLAPELPPLAPLPAANKRAAKEPKPPKEPRAPKEPRPPKAPRPPKRRQTEGDGTSAEGSQPKKRRKKKDSLAPGQENAGHLPEMPGGPDGQHYNNELPGDVGSGENGASLPVSQTASVNGDVHSQSILNLPPGEAARRREVAIQLLTQHKLDPATLSPEQFSIFANQSPELQQESLALLVRYGAERLRVVHPAEKEGSSETPTPEGDGHNGGRVHSETSGATKPQKSRSRKSDGATAQQQGEGGGTAKVKYTRGACELCRASKDKCDKQKPMCSPCLSAGLNCVYALAKSRASRGPKEALEDPEIAAHGEQSQANDPMDPGQPETMEVQHHTEYPEPEHIEPEHVESEQAEAEDEPDDLGSPGFHHPGPAEAPHADLVHPPVETPQTAYSQSTGMYQQQSSGLRFPAASSTTVHEDSHQLSMASAAIDYLSAPSAGAETTMPNFTYPPPAPEPQLTFPEHPEPAVQHVTQHAPATHQRTSSRRALPMSQPSQSHAMNGSGTESHVNSWTAVSNSRVATAVTNTPSPVINKAQPPAAHPAPRAYDDGRQSSNWSATAQPAASNTKSPAYPSPRQVAAQTARAKSRQANRPQTRTPVPTAPVPARPAQVSVHQAANTVSAHNSNTDASTASSAFSSYDYNQYSTTRAESTNSRVAYEPYSSHPAPTGSTSYSGYDTYNPRQTTSTASTGLVNPVSQTVASSYNATTVTAPSSSQWGATATNPTSRNNQSYSASQPASAATSYGGQQQSQSLQNFNVRPQPPAQARSSISAYGQHGQQPQQQQQQRQQPQQQSHQQHQQSYTGYSNQQHTNNASQQQQQQQRWYGFNSANNSAAAGGNSAYSGTASHTHGNTAGAGTYNQSHHRSMNLSGHAYTNMDGEQALYDLLRNNPSG